MKSLVVLATALLLTTSVLPANADGCGIGNKVNNYNNMDDPSPNDKADVLKVIINHLDDPHHDADYVGCTKTEMEQADGFLADYIDYIRHNPKPNTQAATAYARSVQDRLHDAINRLDSGN
jgi:hypothetical protein